MISYHNAKACGQCTGPPLMTRGPFYYQLICDHKTLVHPNKEKLVSIWNRKVEHGKT